MTDSDILRAFESLGDNCEFGLVQSSLGVEQLGFFRFNSVSADALLHAIESDFADFENPNGLEIEIACNDELIVHIPGYGFRYHTFYWRGDVDIDRLRRQQTTVVRFLARKFREDLRAAEKIFVWKSAASSSEEMAALHAALRRYGDATLLWVTLKDDTKCAGEVELLGPGLLKGHIDRFSAYKDASAASFAWFDICRGAHAIWRGFDASERHRNAGLAAERYRITPLDELASGFVVGAYPNKQDALRFVVLHDAIVRGDNGTVTVGDAAVAETLVQTPDGALEGQLQLSAAHFMLPEVPVAPTVAAAYHLFGGVGEDEERRLEAVIARFSTCVYDSFAKQTLGQAAPILLFPDMEGFGLLSALRQLAPRRVPRLAVPANRAVRVQRLCVPYSRVA
jgi:hypothetical protein